MQYDRIKKLKLAERKDATTRMMERYEIFIAGPFIDIKKDRSANENSSTSGKLIRFDSYSYYASKGHNIYLGEDVELKNLGDKHYGSLSNAAFYERHHIVNYINALIVFPDGPGVFCELGDWSTTAETCKKMLIVMNKKYKNDKSYINEGTIKSAKHFGATVIYEDYDDFKSVINSCDHFIDLIASSARVEKLFGR
jgi:hypothetical protein